VKAEFEQWLARSAGAKHFRDCKHKHHYISECGCWMRRIWEAGHSSGKRDRKIILDDTSVQAIAVAIKGAE
jgi:hypothetical protein